MERRKVGRRKKGELNTIVTRRKDQIKRPVGAKLFFSFTSFSVFFFSILFFVFVGVKGEND